jgi:hypothetical protein
MVHFVFRCPATGRNVQRQLDDDPDISENEYEAVRCLACAGLHLVNRKTGNILGQDANILGQNEKDRLATCVRAGSPRSN